MGRRLVFQSQHGDELIVSGWSIVGSGKVQALNDAVAQLRSNALTAVQHAVDFPDLRVLAPLHEDRTSAGLKCWKIDAQSTDGAILFLQAVVESESGVLLITYETAPNDSSREWFRSFVDSVRRSGEARGPM